MSDDFTVLGIIEKPTGSLVEKLMVNGTVIVSMNLFKLDYMAAITVLEKVSYRSELNEKELPVPWSL